MVGSSPFLTNKHLLRALEDEVASWVVATLPLGHFLGRSFPFKDAPLATHHERDGPEGDFLDQSCPDERVAIGQLVTDAAIFKVAFDVDLVGHVSLATQHGRHGFLLAVAVGDEGLSYWMCPVNSNTHCSLAKIPSSS